MLEQALNSVKSEIKGKEKKESCSSLKAFSIGIATQLITTAGTDPQTINSYLKTRKKVIDEVATLSDKNGCKNPPKCGSCDPYDGNFSVTINGLCECPKK